jgi:virulence factor Mce-like protein
MKSGAVRPLAGLGLVVALGLIFALAVGLFRGSFTETVPVTVLSDRAGLVMNPDARVKMRGVQVGKVASIESKPDGQAAIHLAMDPSQMHLIPSNVLVDITSSTVFGAKFVQLDAPKDPSPEKLRAGQVIQSQHVTVEINTVFQQLVSVLDKIDPAKLNETLGAIATAFNGRGEKLGQTLSDFNAFLAKIEPSLPNLSRDIETSVPVLTAYGDAAPDLVKTVDNSTRLSRSIVEEQDNLDAFLVSATGLAEVGNDGSATRGSEERDGPLGADHRSAGQVPRARVVHRRRARPVHELAPMPYPVSTSVQLHPRRRALPVPAGSAEGQRKGQQVVLPGARPAEPAVRVPAAVPGWRRRNQPVQVR